MGLNKYLSIFYDVLSWGSYSGGVIFAGISSLGESNLIELGLGACVGGSIMVLGKIIYEKHNLERENKVLDNKNSLLEKKLNKLE